MKKIIAALAILLGLSAAAHAGPLPEPSPRLTRLAYMRLAGGQYMLRSLPLFDVNPVGGVSIVGGGGGVSTSGTNVWTGSNTFTDSLFFLADDGDATKKLQFQLSGITTGNTLTPFSFSGTTAAPITTVTGVLSLPTGTIALTSISFAGGTAGSGIYGRATSTDISANGLWAAEFGVAAIGLGLPSNSQMGFSSTTTAGAANDVFFKRAAAASMQLGLDVNGAPVDQTFKAHNGITGTDIAGAALIHEAGIGTGAAVSHPYTINRQIVKASGTTVQTYAPAFITCISKTMSTSSATAQAVATITTTSTTAGAVEWFYTTTASNGTLLDSDTGEILVAWNNNAGTVAATAGTAIGGVSSAASGTLASTPTATVATNVVSLKLTPTWAVIVPTVVTTYSTFLVASSADTVVCQ